MGREVRRGTRTSIIDQHYNLRRCCCQLDAFGIGFGSELVAFVAGAAVEAEAVLGYGCRIASLSYPTYFSLNSHNMDSKAQRKKRTSGGSPQAAAILLQTP